MELNEDHFKQKRYQTKLQQLEHFVCDKFMEAGTSGFSIFINYSIKDMHTYKNADVFVSVCVWVCELRLSNDKNEFFL